MSDLRKAAEMALEEFELFFNTYPHMEKGYTLDAREALRQALTEPEQEPVAWGMPRDDGTILDVICPEEHAREPGNYTIPLYTAPPKREWSGLSVSKAEDLLGEFENDPYEMLFALDKYLREKNT